MSSTMAIFHTVETAANFTANVTANGAYGVEDYNQGINWNYHRPTYTGGFPVQWQESTGPKWNEWVPQGDLYPAPPQFRNFMNCPHCGRNIEVPSDWTCTNCRQSLFTVSPFQATPGSINWGRKIVIPLPPEYPAPEVKEAPPAEKPEQRDNHPGDGSRWDDLL